MTPRQPHINRAETNWQNFRRGVPSGNSIPVTSV
ncbi:protein of unknown function [Streptomyces sp. KY75]|nr:protein of unknown function [Streptomyces sp. KY70]CAD5993160.1 protein of unknown function [Streptomyces sp. KY75]